MRYGWHFALLDIPGVILADTLLTVWNKILALHCDDVLYPVSVYQIEANICRSSSTTWDLPGVSGHLSFDMILVNWKKKKKIDCSSVKKLEGLAPRGHVCSLRKSWNHTGTSHAQDAHQLHGSFMLNNAIQPLLLSDKLFLFIHLPLLFIAA